MPWAAPKTNYNAPSGYMELGQYGMTQMQHEGQKEMVWGVRSASEKSYYVDARQTTGEGMPSGLGVTSQYLMDMDAATPTHGQFRWLGDVKERTSFQAGGRGSSRTEYKYTDTDIGGKWQVYSDRDIGRGGNYRGDVGWLNWEGGTNLGNLKWDNYDGTIATDFKQEQEIKEPGSTSPGNKYGPPLPNRSATPQAFFAGSAKINWNPLAKRKV